jgi:hypothetical protein
VQEWEYFSKLSPIEQREYLKMRRGSEGLVQVQGTDGQAVYAPRSEAVGQRAPVRATSGGGSVPAPMTATQRAKLLSEASAAIAAGAPKAAVQARLAEMGVQ